MGVGQTQDILLATGHTCLCMQYFGIFNIILCSDEHLPSLLSHKLFDPTCYYSEADIIMETYETNAPRADNRAGDGICSQRRASVARKDAEEVRGPLAT